MATTRSVERRRIVTINGLRLTHKHPVQLGGSQRWVFPKDIASCCVAEPAEPLTVHNFVLSGGGAMRVNDMVVVTLGDNAAAGMAADDPCSHPVYGTRKVVEHLKALPSWPECLW